MNPPSPLHVALREGTQDVHEALHHHPLLQGLATGDITLQQWLLALSAFKQFYALYEPQERRLSTAPSAPVQLWLDKDFAGQGAIPASPRLHFTALDLCDTSSLMAYLYVKQGSTLGGQVISKKLRHSLGLIGGEDQHFFYGYGPHTGEEWKRFLSRLAEADADVEETVGIAQALFAQLAEICDAIYRQSHNADNKTDTPYGTGRDPA